MDGEDGAAVGRALLRGMLRVRIVEEEIAARYPEQEMRCPTHLCVGQESPAVGVCAALERRDQVLSAHRSHGHYLAKGGDLDAMIAELYGRATGCSGGKGGSMHLIDLDAGFLGAVPIVSSTVPIAVGVALAAKLRGLDRVAVVFLGDAAVEEGVTHESLSFAALEALPVLFVCENNLYSVQTPLSARQPAGREIHELARAHTVEAHRVAGDDVRDVHRLARAAVARARAGGGPTFLEIDTYRYLEHVGPYEDHDLGYRTAEEVERWRARDPIAFLERALVEEGALDAAEVAATRAELKARVELAFERAIAAPMPDPARLHEGVFAGTASPIDGGAP